MSLLAHRIAELAAALPEDKQGEVLDFVEFLHARSHRTTDGTMSERPPRRLGTLAGQFVVPDDFNDPLPAGIQQYFEGEGDVPTCYTSRCLGSGSQWVS